MPRIALTAQQKMEYKLVDFKIWVDGQMRRNHISQAEVGKALGISQGRVSQMLKVPDKKKKGKDVNLDPFSLGQVIALFELFQADEDEIKKLLKL